MEIKQFNTHEELPGEDYLIDFCDENLKVTGDPKVNGGTAICPILNVSIRIDSLGICDEKSCSHQRFPSK